MKITMKVIDAEKFHTSMCDMAQNHYHKEDGQVIADVLQCVIEAVEASTKSVEVEDGK